MAICGSGKLRAPASVNPFVQWPEGLMDALYDGCRFGEVGSPGIPRSLTVRSIPLSRPSWDRAGRTRRDTSCRDEWHASCAAPPIIMAKRSKECAGGLAEFTRLHLHWDLQH